MGKSIAKYKYPRGLQKNTRMIITIKYFGLLAEITQKKEEQLVLTENKPSVAFLKSKIETLYQELKKVNYSIAINQALTNIDAALNNQDTVAFLPPFAGG